ncbi:Plasmodium exported protein, unknown function [Plasmodium yoelii]|uniref:Uncharacterized protein n=1 Tax=Plasmodium yoelii TaxID=5861 RepID=A0A077Y0E8_PLAYE|nr:Plasmodium exported protein, unknown function [Plasmodium yoelii]
MANCSRVSGKLFLLSIILLLPYIINYANNKGNNHNVSFATNNELKRLLAEPANDLEANNNPQYGAVNYKPVNAANASPVNAANASPVNAANANPVNAADANPVNAADANPNDDAEYDPDEDYYSDAESFLGSDSEYEMFSDPESSLESESESEPEFINEVSHEERPKFFRKSKQNNDESQTEENDVESNQGAAGGMPLNNLFQGVNQDEIQKMFATMPFHISNIINFKGMLNNDVSNDEEVDEEKKAHMDAKIGKIGNMLTEFISKFNLGDSIQQNMDEIIGLTQNCDLDSDPMSFLKFISVATTLASSFADTFKDENGKPDKRKMQEQGKLMSEHMQHIIKEVSKPLPEAQTKNKPSKN